MKILVPTDFSDNAMKAALYAAELAKQTKAEIILLNAMELGYEKIRQPFPLHEKYDKMVLDSRKTDINITKESILTLYEELQIKTELADGLPVESILEVARRESVDLIVMGTTGAGRIKEAFVGTVAAAVSSRSSIPVLIVPAQYEMEKPDGIVFTTNRFEENTKILAILIKIARIFHTAVHTVVFVDKDTAKADEYLEKGRKMDHYLKFLKESYPDIYFSGELIEGSDFEAAITLYHAKHQTDISAMVTYPKELWQRLLHKSATKKMIYHSKIPVLAIPSPEKSGERRNTALN